MADYSNTKDAIRLCEIIVRDAFGEIVGRTAATLLNRGRLNLPNLTRLSGLRPAQTTNALIILIQHNLVLTDGASFWKESDLDLYQFDLQQCLLRLRWPRMLAIAKNKFDGVAVEAVRQLMIYGKMEVGDIVELLSGGDARQQQRVEETIIKLLRANYLECCAPEQQVSCADRVDRRFTRLKRAGRDGPEGKRHLPTPNELANWEDEAIKAENDKVADYRSTERALKRNVKVDKRAKKTKNDDDFTLIPNVMLRLDYDRFGVTIRDEMLVDCARDRWNEGAAQVTKVVLDQVLSPDSRLIDPESDVVDVNRLMDKFNKHASAILAAGIIGAPKNAAEIIKEYMDLMSGADRQLEQKDVNAFFAGDSTMYHVAFAVVGIKLRATLMMDLVRSHLGGKAARVLATVAKAHTVSEQMVRDVAMMPLKEARQHLAKLHTMGLIETSEVSKNPLLKRQTMTATSEHNFWSLDPARAYTVLLTSVYKTLANILQRQSSEREKKRPALDREMAAAKKGYGRDILSQADQEDLKVYDDMMNKLSLAASRCDMVVFIIRDMPGWPTKRKDAAKD